VDRALLPLQEECSEIRKQISLLGFSALHRAEVFLDKVRRQQRRNRRVVVSLDLLSPSRVVGCLNRRRRILNLNKEAGCSQLLGRNRRKPSQLVEDSLGILLNQLNRLDSLVG
jgi:hypothetical protein